MPSRSIGDYWRWQKDAYGAAVCVDENHDIVYGGPGSLGARLHVYDQDTGTLLDEWSLGGTSSTRISYEGVRVSHDGTPVVSLA